MVNLTNKTVLVTGGAGFIGSHTVDALVARGARVVVIDNLSTGKKENINPKAIFHNINIADKEIETIIDREKPSFIYHFAFFVLVPLSVENPLLDLDVMTGTLRILQKAKSLPLEKFVFASSGFLYGNDSPLPINEQAPVSPISPYIVSKRAIENYLWFYHNAFGLPYVVLRYAAIYGPRQHTGAMADYIRKLGTNKQAEMWGDGTKTRDYVYIDDVVRANLLALSVPQTHPNPTFNIGTGVETSLNTLYSQIATKLNKQPKPIYYNDRAGEQIRYALDNTRAQQALGWKPEHSLEKGLAPTISFAQNKNFEI